MAKSTGFPSRRSFLRIAGAGALGATMIPRWSAADSPGVPKRLILFPSLNGTRHPDFWPGADGRLATITSPLEALRDQVTFVRGLSMQGSWDHFAVRSMFTGAAIRSYADPEPRVRSFDQIVADTIMAGSPTPIRSLHLGARPAQYLGAAFNGRQNIFRTAAEAVQVRANPVSVFDDVFASMGPAPAPAPPAAGASWERAALQIAQAELAELEGRNLGASQRMKTDAHRESLGRLIPDEVAPPVMNVSCDSGSIASVEALRGELQGNEAAAYEDRLYPQIVDAQIDLMARAITCGVTRVATLQSSWADGDVTVPVEGGERLPWHPTSHDRPEAYALLQQWYVGKLARLATLLDAPDPLDASGSSTVLDNTVILWMSECEPSHNADEVSAMIVGGRCAGVNAGGLVRGSSNVQLLRTLCGVFDVPESDAGQFGSSTISELV
ncbi:MAG: DUF1552 domain-containing protein [Polyangiales bacterium]